MAIKLLEYRHGQVPLTIEPRGKDWDTIITFPGTSDKPGIEIYNTLPSVDGRESMNDLHLYIAESYDKNSEDFDRFYHWTRIFISVYGHPYKATLFKIENSLDFPIKAWRDDCRAIRDYAAKARTIAGRKWLLEVGAPGKITPSQSQAPLNYRLMNNCSAQLVEPRGGGRPDLKAKSKGIKLDVAMQPNNVLGWCYGLIARDAELSIRYKKCGNKKGCDRKVPSITPGNITGAKYCCLRCRKAVEVGRR